MELPCCFWRTLVNLVLTWKLHPSDELSQCWNLLCILLEERGNSHSYLAMSSVSYANHQSEHVFKLTFPCFSHSLPLYLCLLSVSCTPRPSQSIELDSSLSMSLSVCINHLLLYSKRLQFSRLKIKHLLPLFPKVRDPGVQVSFQLRVSHEMATKD